MNTLFLSFLQDIILYTSVRTEKAVIGDNNVTYLLNKGVEGYFGASKFIASQFNKGVYDIADKSSKIMYAIDYKLGITDSIINKASEVAAYSYEGLSNTVSAIGAYSYDGLSNTVSVVSEFGTATYENLSSNTVWESIKSDIEELDLGNQFFTEHEAIMWGIS